MTENNILNLPTYEQVEHVRSTSGMTLDIDDKQYKAVMNHDRKIVTGYGKGVWDDLQKDYETKFPSHYADYKLSVATAGKTHIGGNRFYIQTSGGYGYLIVDLNTMTCLIAAKIDDVYFRGFFHSNWFKTDKHLFLRCTPNQNNTLGWAVLDINTYKYIRTIYDLSSGVSYPVNFNQQFMIGREISFKNNCLYVVFNTDANHIWTWKLSYDGNGVPQGYTYIAAFGFSANSLTASSFGRAIWIWGDYMYIIYSLASNQYMLTKKAIKSDGTLDNGPIVSISDTAPNTMSTWQEFIMVGTVPHILIQFGQGSGALTLFFNIDMMSKAQTIYNGNSSGGLPFDYVNKDKIIIQSYLISGERFGTNVPCEFFYEFNMRPDGYWAATTYYTPLRTQITGNFGDNTTMKETWFRRIIFEGYGLYKDGKWYGQMDGSRNGAELGALHLIDGYKEVIQ